ncbi:MAG: hypothetical protein ABSG03_00330 [Bryobacteraceae bacterium]
MQPPAPVQPPVQKPKQDDSSVQAPEDKRVFGVLPNYRTTENSIPFKRITAKQKLKIALKDSFDWPAYLTGGLFAGLYQLENSNPSFGQGTAGYFRRFGTSSGDQIIGNMMTEGIVPSLIHQDPRYFRLGSTGGTKKHRVLYALESIMVARMDTGNKSFNFSEWGGNAINASIGNAYYPDGRSASATGQRLLIDCGTDALSNVLKEFWPDVKQWYKNRKHKDEPAAAPVVTSSSSSH